MGLLSLKLMEEIKENSLTKDSLESKKNILHMISPQENVSPFDVNMACDAGYDIVMPYTSVNLPMLRV